ncbi:HPP family protein [Paenibacillus hexagrammi]|uniref:HPP family protein n=1 Tax=Paenibacillus hexagrammi TaxID=2908839 RepID=A0ABY3SPG1_9BACL|nr:HPP family protein [Paenibacillus sp. YPD9-1]UJF35838.1 HPP family protein [Paenibacillus sp. YPD9-1]
MNVKIIVCSLFLMLIYMISLQINSMHMLFYPTLGAFGFLFSSRQSSLFEMGKMLLGATAGSIIGAGLYMMYSGPVTIFIAALLVMKMIVTFKLNSPPIMAICLIPYFSHPVTPWLAPIFTLISLGCLFLTLWLSDRIVQRMQAHPLLSRLWVRNRLLQEGHNKTVSS